MPGLPESIELPADKTVKDLITKLGYPYSLKVWTGRSYHGDKKPLANIDGDTPTVYKGTGLDAAAPRNRVAAALLQGQETVT